MEGKRRLLYILITICLFIIVIFSILNNRNQEEIRDHESVYSISPKISWGMAEGTEYDTFTGKWFGEGNGNIGFGISSGTMEPRSEVSVSLMAISVVEVNLDRNVRFQLTKRDQDNKLLKVIEEKTVHIDTISSASNKEYFTSQLPETENAHYMLSTEIFSKDGQVEDTIVTGIFVPNQIGVGELYLEKNKYTAKETLVLKLRNNGSTNFTFGLVYEIEKFKQNKWEPIPLKGEVKAIGIILEPGQIFEQKIPLDQLKERGQYRILKDIVVEGTYITPETLSVEFEVK